MSKAEDRALEAYPVIMHTLIPMNDDAPEIEQDCNKFHRQAYIEGYQQAEKDLALTWKDIADILDITDIIANDDSMEERLKHMSEEEYCHEVLKRFKDFKK